MGTCTARSLKCSTLGILRPAPPAEAGGRNGSLSFAHCTHGKGMRQERQLMRPSVALGLEHAMMIKHDAMMNFDDEFSDDHDDDIRI
jgi:hypothetical protein